MLIGGWIGWRAFDQRTAHADAYSRAEAAQLSGDLVAALDAYGEAGGYRDAPERRQAVRRELAPYEAAYLDSLAAAEAGRFDEAIELLLPLVNAMPGLEKHRSLLEDARRGQLTDLERQIELAIAGRDWLAADRLLSQLLSLNPGDPAILEQLEAIRTHHAPLLFARNSAIITIGPDLADERLLFDEIPAASPIWSPDRSRIAFFSPDPQALALGSLYVIDASGENLQRIAHGVILDPFPAWSPDGTKLAYVKAETAADLTPSESTSIRIFDFDEGLERNLTAGRLANPNPSMPTMVTVTSPNWSPDGTQLAFIAIQRPLSDSVGVISRIGSVMVANLNTGRLESPFDSKLPAAASVTWSPTSNQLLVWEARGGTAWYETHETKISFVDLDAMSIEAVSSVMTLTGRPVWSPDGTRFAYVESKDSVVLHWLATSNETRVESPRAISDLITWSPNGDAVVAMAADPATPSILIEAGTDPPELRDIPLIFDTSWPNLGAQWGPLTPPLPVEPQSLAGTALDGQRSALGRSEPIASGHEPSR